MNAFILIGGLSRRFGSDKSQAIINNATFAEYLHVMLSQEFASVTLVGKNNPFPQLPFISDEFEIQCPLVGLYTGLKNSKSDWNFFISVDTPLAGDNLIQQLRSQAKLPIQCVVPKIKDQVHPLCGFYHLTALAPIQENIENGSYRLQDLVKYLRTQIVDLSENDNQLLNVNTPEDYQKLIETLSKPKNRG